MTAIVLTTRDGQSIYHDVVKVERTETSVTLYDSAAFAFHVIPIAEFKKIELI